LPKGPYIAWFGTAHKGFSQQNGDNNGYAWLSNYHESGKLNPNSSFQPNYVIKIKVKKKIYKINNVETPYHMFKFYTQITPEGAKPKPINYDTYARLDPNAARSGANGINQFNFGKADKLMFHLLEQKFFNNNWMAKALLDTGNMLLFEGNRWKDKRFGMEFSGGDSITFGIPPEGAAHWMVQISSAKCS
jgi:hypothetical protein